MITEEIAHINGIPKKLIVFLHGYQDYAEHIDRKTSALKQLPDIAFHIPQAPFASEIDEQKKQWFSMHRFDPEDRRRLTPSWIEFVEYYNRMTIGLAEANQYIAEYVDSLLNEYGLGYEDLFLCGFSQGAMCAMYTALMCPHKVAAVISFSGILAAQGYIAQHLKSRPEFFLLHGRCDNKIRFEAMEFTKQNLQELHCKVETCALEQATHRLVSEAVDKAVLFIKDRLK